MEGGLVCVVLEDDLEVVVAVDAAAAEPVVVASVANLKMQVSPQRTKSPSAIYPRHLGIFKLIRSIYLQILKIFVVPALNER